MKKELGLRRGNISQVRPPPPHSEWYPLVCLNLQHGSGVPLYSAHVVQGTL